MRSLACTSMLPKYIRSFGGSILLYVSFLSVVNRCTIKQKDTSVRVNSGKKDDNSSLPSQINFFWRSNSPNNTQQERRVFHLKMYKRSSVYFLTNKQKVKATVKLFRFAIN
jgi:hypothetical protein